MTPTLLTDRDVLRLLASFTVDTRGCWLWRLRPATKGYGQFFVRGRRVPAHRVVFEHLRAPIPDGLQLDHLCRVRACVNPEHLEIVDGRTNTLRGESFAAQNARKTACPQGHPYAGANLLRHVIRGQPIRRCRTCAHAYQLRLRASRMRRS